MIFLSNFFILIFLSNYQKKGTTIQNNNLDFFGKINFKFIGYGLGPIYEINSYKFAVFSRKKIIISTRAQKKAELERADFEFNDDHILSRRETPYVNTFQCQIPFLLKLSRTFAGF